MALPLLLATACATPQERVEERRTQIATPPITHIVLIQLKDPSRARELVEDCNRSLPGIPSVLAYACGEPLQSERPNVMKNYSVGFFVAFADEAGYKAYTEDPAQTALVEKWRTAWKDVRIFDFLEPANLGFETTMPAGAAPAPTTAPATGSAPATTPSSAPATGPANAPSSAPATAPATEPASSPTPGSPSTGGSIGSDPAKPGSVTPPTAR